MQPSRRTVLVAAALSVTAACRHRSSGQAVPDPDEALRAAALERERQLLAAYQAVMTAHPALAAQLRLLAADKAVHVAALGSPGTATSNVRTPAELRALERSAATEHGRAAVTASRSLAPLLASLSASSSCAAAVL
ncbi:MAG: hypothetical protein ABR549_00635 [Mycobacteriales bacterium]